MSRDIVGESVATIPYWNTNLPKDQWTEECPDYLLDIYERDKVQLGIRDEDYDLMKWEKAKQLVGWPAPAISE